MKSGNVRNVRDLAERLGVSKSTVSLALRNHPRISEKTRKLVQQEAERMGYRPSALVSALMTQIRGKEIRQNSECLAFLTAYPAADDWRQLTSLRDAFEAAKAQAARSGFRLEPLWLGPRGEQSRQAARIMKARGIRGAMIAPLPPGVADLELAWGEQVTVTTGFSFRQHALHRCVHNHFTGMMECYRRLRTAGRSRVGLFLHKEADDRVNHLWMAGYLAAQQVHGGATLPMLLLDGAQARPGDREKFDAWIAAHSPDAVIGIYPDFAWTWLNERNGGRAGGIAYASVDLYHGQIGEIAGIRQDWESIGMGAVDMLVGTLFRNEYGLPAKPKLTLLEGQWKDGLSVPAPSAATADAG